MVIYRLSLGFWVVIIQYFTQWLLDNLPVITFQRLYSQIVCHKHSLHDVPRSMLLCLMVDGSESDDDNDPNR